MNWCLMHDHCEVFVITVRYLQLLYSLLLLLSRVLLGTVISNCEINKVESNQNMGILELLLMS